MMSLEMARWIVPRPEKPVDGEQLLKRNQASPVGYTVPHLPDFEMDPCWERPTISCVNVHVEFALSLIVAVVLGIAMVALSFTDWEAVLYVSMKNRIRGFLES